MAGGFRTTIDITGLDKPIAALVKLRELGADGTPFMRDARDTMVASILQRFETGKGPGGIPWKPSRRALGKVKGKPSGRTLVDTEDLQDSIRGEFNSTTAEAGSDGLKSPVKALANQFGSHRQSVVLAHKRRITVVFGAALRTPREVNVRAHGRITNLPARPFVGVDDADIDQIKDLWQARIIATFGTGAKNV